MDNEYLEDLEYEEAEGAADLFLEDDYEEDYEDDFEEDYEDDLEEDYEDDFYEDDIEDDYEDDLYDAFEDDDFEDDDLEDTLAYALAAEDTDEFFKRLFKGAKKLFKKVAPVVGKVARVAAPILSKIPHPYAQIAGKAAGLIGKLRAEGATEEEALEAMAELASRDRRAVPLVAGIAARTLVKRKGAVMPKSQRKHVVRAMNKTAKTMVRKRGPKAVRAFAKITKSVKNTTAAKGTPTMAKPKVVQRTAAKVAKSPTMTRKLSKPSPKAKRTVRKVVAGKAGGRSYTIAGPARITITAV